MQRFTTPILLAYNAENEIAVKRLTDRLKAVLDFKYASIQRDQEESLTALAQGFEGPILLFVSDNFLRSTKCMQGGLRMLNEHKDQILPVVIPGFRLQENGEQELIETSFERVSDIIQYINFWQDRYLDLRRQKREDPTLDTPGFEQHLKAIRSISGEAGEYLRLLRGIEHLHLSEFEENNYEALFEFLDAEAIGEQLTADTEQDPPAAEDLPEEAPKAEPEPSAEKEETKEQANADKNEEDQEEEPPLDLTGIPGISLISDEPVDEQPEEAPAELQETSSPEEKQAVETEATAEQPEDVPQEPLAGNQEAEEDPAPEEEPAQPEESQPEETAEQQAALLVDKAWRLVDGGELAAAAALISAGLDEFPQSDVLQYNYALLLAQQDQTHDAKQVIDDLLTRNPQHENALYLAAELADLNDKPALAQKYLVRLVRLKDQGPAVWYKMGLLSLQKDPPKLGEAERYLKEATKRDDCPAEAYYELGLLYHQIGKNKKALKFFRKTAELQPDHPFVHYDLALLLHKKGKEKRAFSAYQKAISINPEIQTAENDAAFALPEKQNKQEEQQDTLQALKTNVERLEELIHQQEEQKQPKGTDQTVLITGGTSGIGRATAEKYAAHGFRIIITGRRKERLEELQQQWQNEYGVEVYCLNFDVRDADEVQSAISSLPEEWFDIDILVNNAGKAKGFDPIHEGQLDHWEEMIDTNLKGLLYLTRVISPRMVARGKGHIINVASTAGKEVYPNGNVYCATKHAVDALTKAMRLDLHQHGVRVSQVAPAHVEETEFALVRFDGDAERAKIYNDFKPLSSHDVAETIYFISQQPAHVNILDVVLQGTQQANSTTIDRSGRDRYEEEE